MPLDSTYFTIVEKFEDLKISQYASQVLTDLFKWAELNQKVKRKINFSIPYDSDIFNAGFNHESNTVVVYYPYIQEIYINCMLFPLYNEEMSNIDDFESYVAALKCIYEN
ncbi:hypothetical protein [Pantoea stewartii]|uniref:hypothetical protein n=1 Tax=Pantoea stewartii TaxID=66269 RepID=UPI0033667D79